MVTVRATDQRLLHELVSRHFGDGPKDAGVSDAAALELLRDHATARKLEPSGIPKT
jgi:hypothetical protein